MPGKTGALGSLSREAKRRDFTESESTEPPYGPEWAAAAEGTNIRRVGLVVHSD